MGDIGVARECSDDESAVGRRLDLVERKNVDVDDLFGALDVELHQVNQRRATGNETNFCGLLRCRRGCPQLDGLVNGGGSTELERIHFFTPIPVSAARLVCGWTVRLRRCWDRRHSGRYCRTWPA